MTDSGVTTADFIEGAGKSIEEGANVGIAKIAENTYKFDLLSGFIDTSNFIEKSSTSGLIRNDGSIDTSDYALESEIPDISGKADKVLDAVAGDFPILLANGNVGNSGKKPSDFALKSEMSVTDGTGADADKVTIQLKSGTSTTVLKTHQDISGKVDKETGKGLSTNDYDNTAKGIVDSVTTNLATKADKVTNATNGNLAGLNGSGNLTDSGWNGAKDTTSISGNPISISGLKANQLAVNPIITLEPIQDLHGQSKPYPAGGGKNKYGSGDVSGTQNATVNLSIPAGTYTISAVCTSSDTDASTCLALVRYTDTTYHTGVQLQRTNRSSATFVLAKQAASITFYASDTNAHSSGDTFTVKSIQIEEGTQSTSYAPYSNICPISGYDKIEVLSCGKNLVYKRLSGLSINDSGTVVSLASYDLLLVKVVKDAIYTMTKGTSDYDICAFFTSEPALNSVSYNNARTFIQQTDLSFSITAPITGYMAFRTVSNYANPHCEYGSTSLTYEDYHKTTSISESLG